MRQMIESYKSKSTVYEYVYWKLRTYKDAESYKSKSTVLYSVYTESYEPTKMLKLQLCILKMCTVSYEAS